MPTPIAMPRLGMTMTEGRVVSWPVPLGERVDKGQVVLIIESEKAEVEIEATARGIFRHVYVEPGETVPCGTLLAAITETAGETFDAESFRRQHQGAAAPTAPRHVENAPPRPSAPAVKSGPAAGRVPVTPAARRRAKELGVDVEKLGGSGPGGRVTQEDVEAWAERRRALVEVAPGVSLEVPSQGAGDPVLLLPGFGTDVSAFTRQVPVLAERFRVLGVNPRGVGLSDAPEQESYPVPVTASDAAAVLPGPSHVIGASLGAAAAIELALTHPDRVRSLTLITPFVRATARLLAVTDAWCRLAAVADPESLAAALLPWLFSESLLADESARDRTHRGLAATVSRVPAPSLARHTTGLRAWSGTRAADLGRISVPTLVIAAGEDLLTPGAEAVAEGIPNAELVTVQGAGHAVALEKPEPVNEAILAFIGGRRSARR